MPFDVLLETLAIVLAPINIFYILIGVILSSTLVALPGFNTKMAITLCLPFLFYMNPVGGLCLLISIVAVSCTANSVPSILFAVPGGSASQAVIIDGYQMARRGEAGRALIASFTASAIGGIFGSVVLLMTLPMMSSILMWFGPVELFCLVFLGIMMVAVLSGSSPLDGIIVGLLGVLVGMVGMDFSTAELRYTFGIPEMMDGFNIVAVVTGLFALPELASLFVTQSSISKKTKPEPISSMVQGFYDVLQNKTITFYNSVLGAVCGCIPGIGGGIIDWISYTFTKRYASNSQKIGTGDVRSVIAVDSATNAKEGGALIPTLIFGIPGTSTLALVLACFDIIEVPVGPDLVNHPENYLYVIFWILIISTIITSALCILCTPLLTRITSMRTGVLVPHLTVLLCVAVFLVTNNYFNLWVVIGFAVFGFWLKQHNWPRAPFLIGYVLGPGAEQHFGTSFQIHGLSLLVHPSVLFCLAVVSIYTFFSVRRTR